MVLHMKRKRVLNGRPRVLTNTQVLKIRRRWKQREKGMALAVEFHVSEGTISRVINAKPPYNFK